MKKQLSEMSKDERSLLLFFETAAVDCGGKVNTAHMNAEDIKIAKDWTNEGFVTFSRIVFKHINGVTSYSVVLSDDAWRIAHEERKERFNRLYSKKSWLTISEYHALKIKEHEY